MIELIKEKWLTFFLVFVISGVLAFSFSKFLLTPKYDSVAVIFPPNTHANIHLVSAGMRFGYDKEIGEHIEIMNSNTVRSLVTLEFNLGQHYEIDESDPFYLDILQGEYDKNIEISRTINKSIHVIVRDKDPDQAAKIANAIVIFSDEHKSNMIKANISIALESAKSTYLKKQKTVISMTDSLDALRQAGESVWTYGEERKSGKFINYELQYRSELERYLGLKSRFEELKTLMNDPLPRSYVVSEAVSSVKPVYPKNSFIALIAGIISTLVYLMFVKLKDL